MHKRTGLITRTQTKKVGKSESESPAIAEAAAAAVAIVVDGAVAIVNPTLEIVVAVMKRLKISRANLVAGCASANCPMLKSETSWSNVKKHVAGKTTLLQT